jgi:phage anti-repressor protein
MKDLQITETKINKELIPTISARELWRKLEVKKDFSNWIKAQVKFFDKDKDYIIYAQKGENLNAGRPTIEYYLTLNCAEHIALMSRTEKGREIRQYFIDVESEWREGKQEYSKLRIKSKKIRNSFTDCLKEHGYTKPQEYIKTTVGMKKNLVIINKKDKMTSNELKKILVSETLSELKIEEQKVNGFNKVNTICLETSKNILKSIKQNTDEISNGVSLIN